MTFLLTKKTVKEDTRLYVMLQQKFFAFALICITMLSNRLAWKHSRHFIHSEVISTPWNLHFGCVHTWCPSMVPDIMMPSSVPEYKVERHGHCARIFAWVLEKKRCVHIDCPSIIVLGHRARAPILNAAFDGHIFLSFASASCICLECWLVPWMASVLCGWPFYCWFFSFALQCYPTT